MSEIKFRGQRFDTKEWIYGSLLEDDIIVTKGATDVDTDYIGFSDDWSSVIKDTVGQYTGLNDKNDIEIYKGDIVKFGEDEQLYEVYQHASGSWSAKGLILWEWISEDGTENEWTVVGNIHENSWLLKI